MSAFTILLGGEFSATPRAFRQIAGTRVIAADAGMRHAAALDVVPELWVGDFDSTPSDLPAQLAAVERQQFPAAKNLTDGELAVEAARERGATSLILVGAFGGPRADHAFLHLTLAMRLAEAGIAILLTSGAQEGILLPTGEFRVDYDSGTIFSVIAFDDLVGLTLTGARWPLDRYDMAFGSSRTISNEVDGKLTGRLESGRAMLIAHPYPEPGF
jgi:thiamine pyrophosphokinase